jgi:hypothetical protein
VNRYTRKGRAALKAGASYAHVGAVANAYQRGDITLSEAAHELEHVLRRAFTIESPPPGADVERLISRVWSTLVRVPPSEWVEMVHELQGTLAGVLRPTVRA